jgi:hypothetical protein
VRSIGFKRLIPERSKASIKLRYRYAREFQHLLKKYDESHIFFLDEIGFSVSMRVKRGRAPKGQRAVRVIPNLRTKNISICCTMSKNGAYKNQDRAYNSVSFEKY